MAEKFYSKYTAEEIEQILNDSNLAPFVLYYDKVNQVYRFFRTKEKRDAWVTAFEAGDMTEEIAAYEFTESFTAPAPYTINISGLKDNQYVLYGSKNVYIEYSFQTVDGNGGEVNESVDVYYTIKTPVGTSTTSNIYNAGQEVKLNVDDYLALGTNVITLLIRGRSTGTTKTQIVTYYVVELSLTSTFDISKRIENNTNFSVTYTVRGQSDKTVEFYIDGKLITTSFVSQLESEATRTQIFNNVDGSLVGPGRHTLQLRANMEAGNQKFYSNLLYYEFVVTGKDQTVILIKEIFPPSTQVIVGTTPGLTGEQYVSRTLDWAYYSSDPLYSSVIVTWRLYVKPEGSDEGHETTLATRNADVVSAESDRAPEPLNFMPTEVGDYQLQAIINGQVIEPSYTISIIANTNNLYETTEGMTMKLSGLGRSNDEPSDTLTSWTNRGYSAEFFNVAWNDNSGWKDDALVLNNGSTAIINNMPFSGGGRDTVDAADKSGCVFEIDFETFNVTNNDCILANIGTDETKLVIKPSEATLRSRLGTMNISAKFKSDERVKLAFVVYPKGSTEASPYRTKNYVFIYNNGVMSACQEYDENDDFVTNTFIELGNALVRDYQGNEYSVCGTIPENTTIIGCDAGIKVYYIRTYNTFINMYSELNNYIIDSGVNLTQLVTKNNIYTPNTRQISVDKLEGTITTVKITGDLDNLINKGEKHIITAGLDIVSPNNSSINMHCDKAEFKNAGQSTLDKPIPSLHVKLDKNNNVCYDRDGKILNKNRWAFRQGNVPEKKFRLQANYMDSSGVHNGAFLRLFDEVASKVTVENQYVLRTPAEQFAYEDYPAIMTAKYGADKDPRGLNWAFPYNLHMVPDSIPCVVVWRKTDKDPFTFLGQYVLMEEKKSNFTSGMRSIYDTVDIDGYPDPFQFKTKGGTKLWDNAGCHQMEILTSTDDLTLFLDDDEWDDTDDKGELVRRKMFELVYPDEDDLLEEDPTGRLIEQEWKLFYDTFLSPVCNTKGPNKYGATIEAAMQGNQEAFNELYGTCINRWHFAAYYCLMLRNCCSDSLVRNMELTTYDTIIDPGSGNYIYGVDDKPWGGWLPKWWDVDMQCGLYQTGSCNLEPMTTRTTIAPGTDNSFALSGRGYVGGMIHSSWLWDGLEKCPQFQADVKTMDAALYRAGWNYVKMSEFFDKEYADYWSQALYNESGITKYLDYNQLINLQGDRTSHRHWFLKTSYDYFDAVNVCGEYTSKTINVRTEIPYDPSQSEVHSITLKVGADSFLGWGTSISNDLTGLQVSKGQSETLVINRALQLNNPLHVFAANKLEEIDFSDIAQFMAADLDLSKTYDDVTGTYLRKVNIGIPKALMNQGTFNRYSTLNVINGVEYLTKVEQLNVQGLNYLRNINFNSMGSLKELYAAGTSMTNFNPANGSNITVAELPTTVVTMSMDRCSLTNNNNCSISWYKTTTSGEQEVTRYYQRVVGGWAKLAGTPTDPISGTVNSMVQLEELTDQAVMGSIYAVVTTESIMSIEQTTVPTTLRNLLFTSMGTDIGTKKLIVDWVRAIAAEEAVLIEEAEQNETPYSSIWENYSLTYTNVNGNTLADIDNEGIIHRPEGVFEVSDLLNIAKIPPAKRRLTGYLIARGTGTDLQGNPDGSFTSEEMNLLMNAFGDDIFRLGSTLCIDCATGGVVISAVGSNTDVDSLGTIRVLQGTSATLSASGFPLIDRNPIYIWSILVPNEDPSLQDTVIKANDINDPEVLYQNLVLNCYTGALSVTEDYRDNYSFKIKVEKFSGELKTGEAERNMTILKRSYPSEATVTLSNFDPSTDTEVVEYINGVYQLKANATYIFDVEFSNPSNYNGNFVDNGNFWTLANSDSRYIERVDSNYADGKNRNNQFKLVVKQLPEVELNPTLMYAATWKNSSITQATPINLSLVKIVDVLVNSANDVLFQVLDRYGIQHAKQYYFSSLELKKATGTINFKQLIDRAPALNVNLLKSLNGGNGTSATVYNIASYLINISGLNLDNCVGLDTDIDISEPKANYRTLSMIGTTVNAIIGNNSKLEELHLGTPTAINIIDPINLESTGLSVESSNALTSVVVKDLADNKTFTGISSIVSSATNLTHIDIRQNTNTVELVESNVVEDLAAMIDNVESNLDITSTLIGHIRSKYVYEISRNKILSRFAASGNIPGLTIDFTGYYVPFIDLAFRSAISSEFGDGIGIIQSQAEDISTLGTILQNNTYITNLSDLYKLVNLDFESNNTSSNATFLGCNNLSSVKFPSSITKLGSYTFVNNDNLTNLDFSLCTRLKIIEDNAFSNCNSHDLIVNLSSCSSLTQANLSGLIDPEEIIIVDNSSIATLVI